MNNLPRPWPCEKCGGRTVWKKWKNPAQWSRRPARLQRYCPVCGQARKNRLNIP